MKDLEVCEASLRQLVAQKSRQGSHQPPKSPDPFAGLTPTAPPPATHDPVPAPRTDPGPTAAGATADPVAGGTPPKAKAAPGATPVAPGRGAAPNPEAAGGDSPSKPGNGAPGIDVSDVFAQLKGKGLEEERQQVPKC